MRRLTFATLLLLAAAPATEPAAYPVHQFHPAHVGDAYDCDVTAAQHVRHARAVAGRPPTAEEADWSVHLLGRCTVGAVDAKGSPTTLTCKIAKLTVTREGKPTDPLPAGAEIEATRPADGPHYRRLDGPLPPGIDRALALVLVAYRADGPTPDDLYPPIRPRAVGDSWPMVAPPARGHVAGHATLVGPATVAGRDCLLVKHVSDTDGPAMLPGGQKGHRNDLSVSTAALPLDGAGWIDMVSKDTVDYDVQSTEPDGTPVDEQTHVVTDTHAARTAAKP